MSLLFNRIVRFSFGRKQDDFIDFRVVTGLFIQFEVEKTLEPNPNRVKIQVYNLTRDSRAVFEPGTLVRLEVGYQNTPEDLFLGDITNVEHEKKGRNTVTTVLAGDGDEEFATAKVNKTLGPGANTKQVVEELARALDIGIGAVKGVTEKVFQQGITLTGNAADRLSEIVDKLGLEWSIQDGKLQILPPDEPSEQLAFILSPDTGLLGSPITGLIGKPEDNEEGLKFKALMRASIKPGSAQAIVSRDIDGWFKVRRALYRGDSRKGPFEVECEAKEIASGETQPSQTLNV